MNYYALYFFDQTRGYYFFRCLFLCGYYSRAAFFFFGKARLLFEGGVFFFGKAVDINDGWIRYVGVRWW